MDVSMHSTASNFLCWEGAQNLIFCMKFGSSFWQKWHGKDLSKLICAIRSSFHFPYTSKEGYQILKQQWMSLLVVHCSTFRAERASNIWYFAWNLSVAFSSNKSMLTMTGWYMLWVSRPIILIYQRKVNSFLCNGAYMRQKVKLT